MSDSVNHPKHYTFHPSGIECIQITRHMNFNKGNAMKYIWRSEMKDSDKEIEDIEKAIWYLTDEVNRLRGVNMTKINELTDEQLAAEWNEWNDKIVNSKSWSASLAAANEFRTECQREIDKRGIIVGNYNDETYYFAKNSGDKKFILWLVDRLVDVYKEKPGTGFVLTLKEFANAGIRLKTAEARLKKIDKIISKMYGI